MVKLAAQCKALLIITVLLLAAEQALAQIYCYPFSTASDAEAQRWQCWFQDACGGSQYSAPTNFLYSTYCGGQAQSGCVQLPNTMSDCRQLIQIQDNTRIPCPSLQCCTPALSAACQQSNNMSCLDVGPDQIACAGFECPAGQVRDQSGVCVYQAPTFPPLPPSPPLPPPYPPSPPPPSPRPPPPTQTPSPSPPPPPLPPIYPPPPTPRPRAPSVPTAPPQVVLPPAPPAPPRSPAPVMPPAPPSVGPQPQPPQSTLPASPPPPFTMPRPAPPPVSQPPWFFPRLPTGAAPPPPQMQPSLQPASATSPPPPPPPAGTAGTLPPPPPARQPNPAPANTPSPASSSPPSSGVPAVVPIVCAVLGMVFIAACVLLCYYCISDRQKGGVTKTDIFHSLFLSRLAKDAARRWSSAAPGSGQQQPGQAQGSHPHSPAAYADKEGSYKRALSFTTTDGSRVPSTHDVAAYVSPRGAAAAAAAPAVRGRLSSLLTSSPAAPPRGSFHHSPGASVAHAHGYGTHDMYAGQVQRASSYTIPAQYYESSMQYHTDHSPAQQAAAHARGNSYMSPPGSPRQHGASIAYHASAPYPSQHATTQQRPYQTGGGGHRASTMQGRVSVSPQRQSRQWYQPQQQGVANTYPRRSVSPSYMPRQSQYPTQQPRITQHGPARSVPLPAGYGTALPAAEMASTHAASAPRATVSVSVPRSSSFGGAGGNERTYVRHGGPGRASGLYGPQSASPRDSRAYSSPNTDRAYSSPQRDDGRRYYTHENPVYDMR